MSQPLKIIFAGTPDFAADHLAALLATEHSIVAVYSQPDRPAGRGKKLQASPVKQLALEHGIEVYQPASLKKEEVQQQLAALDADLMVVVAYGLILPQKVLDTPKYGCINVHGSLLPRWRGAAPIQRAIWAGDTETGVTVMQMDAGLDTGPMLAKQSLPIAATDTSASLYQKLAELGPKALVEAVDQLPQLVPEVQNDEQANYADKLSKQEAKIDWSLSAEQLARNVRAFNPWPIAFFELDVGPIKVWQATVAKGANTKVKSGQILAADKRGLLVACGANGEQALLLESIQLPGKKAMAAADVLNARKDWFEVGTCLL